LPAAPLVEIAAFVSRHGDDAGNPRVGRDDAIQDGIGYWFETIHARFPFLLLSKRPIRSLSRMIFLWLASPRNLFDIVS
jgi:hypothetical protein